MKFQILGIAAVVAVMALSTGCTVYTDASPPDRVVYVDAQPAPLVEVVTDRPAVGYVWVGGSWSRSYYHGRSSWGWHRGHWHR